MKRGKAGVTGYTSTRASRGQGGYFSNASMFCDAQGGLLSKLMKLLLLLLRNILMLVLEYRNEKSIFDEPSLITLSLVMSVC